MILLQYRVSAWGCVTGYSFYGCGLYIGDSFGGYGISYYRYNRDEMAPCLFYLASFGTVALFHDTVSFRTDSFVHRIGESLIKLH